MLGPSGGHSWHNRDRLPRTRGSSLHIGQVFPRRFISAAMAGTLGSGLSAMARLGSATLLLGGGGAVLAVRSQKVEPGTQEDREHLMSIPWVAKLAAEVGKDQVLSPGQMLRDNPLGKLLVEQDHLFEAMIETGQIKELRCYYDGDKQQFISVVSLGKNVCGYPGTTHGGLTATLLDETFGGLAISLWKSGAMGMQPPAYTARLEVDYKKKVPHDSVVLVSTTLETIDKRKIWMLGEVSDGYGNVYAKSKALFVAPQIQNIVKRWFGLPWWGGGKKQ